MRVILLTAIVLSVVLTGCSTPKSDLEKRREAFRLSRVPKTQEKSFRKANGLIASGDQYYSRAKAMLELKARESLLRTSASYYRKAIFLLREIREKTENPTERGYVDKVIEHTNHSLQEAVRALPMFNE